MRELIGAGADCLYEAELRCAVEQAVLPQPGDHQHVGLAHPIFQGLGIADGEAMDAGIERRKPLMQPIGDMGEADRELFGGGKHGRTPFDDKIGPRNAGGPVQPASRHRRLSPFRSDAGCLVISSPAACCILLIWRRVSAASSTSIWTLSTRPWSSATIRHCAVFPSLLAAPGRAGWLLPRVTRRAKFGVHLQCLRSRPGASARS